MTDAPSPELKVFAAAAAALMPTIEAAANEAAAQAGTTPMEALYGIVGALRNSLGDSRAARWRVRLRLYSSADAFAEPVADSDPDLPPDAGGTAVVFGLRAVADYLAQTATAYHDQVCPGLGQEELDRRLKGLRPTISRNGGRAAWRVPYRTWEKLGNKIEREWLARADVERVV